MKKIIILSAITLLAMSAVLFYGFVIGNFSQDGAEIVSNPWGIVSLIDLYAGFLLFSAWIIYREKSLALAIFWTLLMMTLGFWAGSLYVLIHAIKAKGNLKILLLGKHND